MRANLELLSQLNEGSLSITTLPQAGKTTKLPWGGGRGRTTRYLKKERFHYSGGGTSNVVNFSTRSCVSSTTKTYDPVPPWWLFMPQNFQSSLTAGTDLIVVSFALSLLPPKDQGLIFHRSDVHDKRIRVAQLKNRAFAQDVTADLGLS
jgi:hypothetical protein